MTTNNPHDEHATFATLLQAAIDEPGKIHEAFHASPDNDRHSWRDGESGSEGMGCVKEHGRETDKRRR